MLSWLDSNASVLKSSISKFKHLVCLNLTSVFSTCIIKLIVFNKIHFALHI